MKDKLYKSLPHIFQNLLIYFYNMKAYRIRYGGAYSQYREEKKNNRTLSLDELRQVQKERYAKLISFALENSSFYKEKLSKIANVTDIKNIRDLPIISKEILRSNMVEVVVKTKQKLGKSKTGGTTGKSLEVRNFAHNDQERFAFLDDFLSRFGYELGKKTAWFSGKDLLREKDIRIHRFWKTDFIHNVRYYSTFHVKDEYLKYYVENLIKYSPKYLVGFPSTMLEIAKYGINNSYDFPDSTVKAIFPTAETITEESRFYIEKFFKAKLYNQYASSEGAPFIFECENAKLHLELQSGVFEILDDNDQPVNSGRLIVTSFTNEGTPLIRYDIGDRLIMEKEGVRCTCGNHNPLVKEILGRKDDYVYSFEHGKINLGNVSNTLKDTKGIVRFQVVQDSLDVIDILVVKDDSEYDKSVEKKFIQNWRNRVGNRVSLNIKYVEDIPVEKSGKFRLVKNNIKHLI